MFNRYKYIGSFYYFSRLLAQGHAVVQDVFATADTVYIYSAADSLILHIGAKPDKFVETFAVHWYL